MGEKVAWIGLGVMGYPMAGFLQKAGHDVTVYNRTSAKADKWAAEFGGSSAGTPREAAEGASFVFACVGNDDDLRAVVAGPGAGCPGAPGARAGWSSSPMPTGGTCATGPCATC